MLDNLHLVANRKRQRFRPVVHRNVYPSPLVRSALAINNSPYFRLSAAVRVGDDSDFRDMPADRRNRNECSTGFVPKNDNSLARQPDGTLRVGYFLPFASRTLLPLVHFPAGSVVSKQLLRCLVSPPPVNIFSDIDQHDIVRLRNGEDIANPRHRDASAVGVDSSHRVLRDLTKCRAGNYRTFFKLGFRHFDA